VTFKREGSAEVVFNERQFLNYEHWRAKAEAEGNDCNAEDQSTWWDESFGGATDTKPKGPEAIAMDISFNGFEHVYGIPEHASSLSLKETRYVGPENLECLINLCSRGGSNAYTDPYRLYNTDVFEYETDSPMTLYGSIPFMQAQRKGSSVGVFWLNGAETWVDIFKVKESALQQPNVQTHWMSESGILDVFVLLGPSPADVSKAYGELTGYTQLPQLFSIAYHQCRWNYISDEDVKSVDRRFDKHHIPYDVIWLDIEYTNEKKYFTWNHDSFKDPLGMQKQLDEHGRKLVIIIDPHIKKIDDGSYKVVEEMKTKGYAVMNKDGAVYEGHCWPGASHWIDCFNPAARKWWAGLFRLGKFDGTTSITFIWNDMNEPSVFSGPELTMPRDNLHFGHWEHRDVHNINGLTFQNATYHALLERDSGKIRPFTLTRSFFAGSQRVGAMWTGDNEANWKHLAQGFPMLLSSGIAGLPFAGADVPGYFGNPDADLVSRWYQAGAFYPFFRGHAHIDTRRREPYMLAEPFRTIVAQALRLRYSLLPTWYTAFHEASVSGAPILRPHYWVFPDDPAGYAIDDQFFLGSSGLLAKPVVEEGATSVDIYLPANSGLYYDYFDYMIYNAKGKAERVEAPLEKVPLLIRGGHIVPRRDRPRRSSKLMSFDPFTLIVALNPDLTAQGMLYLDDGETFEYVEGAFIHRRFEFARNKLVNQNNVYDSGRRTAAYLKAVNGVVVEKIILIGAPPYWNGRHVAISETGAGKGRLVALDYHASEQGKAAWAVIKKPKVNIATDWVIDFSGEESGSHSEL
jgi:mannosyl-oligosaccharide alpha-1,3-glucosidase